MELNWEIISLVPGLDPYFIRVFQEYLSWYHITKRQELDNDLLQEFSHLIWWNER